MNVKTGVKLDPAYWANRAGLIATTQLSLVVLLGGKNNLLSSNLFSHHNLQCLTKHFPVLTGISYEKVISRL